MISLPPAEIYFIFLLMQIIVEERVDSQELQNQEGVIQIVEVFFCTFCQLRTCDLTVQGWYGYNQLENSVFADSNVRSHKEAESKVLCGGRCWKKLQEMHD
jgi:hypothetical protein